MADEQIKDQTPGTPIGTDEIAVQRTGGGLHVKYTLADVGLYNVAVGEAHSNADFIHGNVTTTPIPLQGYDEALTAIGITVTLTPVSTSNTAKFVVTKAGTYRVTFTIDVKSPSTNENIDFVLNNNGVPTQFKSSVDMTNASVDGGVASVNAFLTVAVADEIEVYASSDGSTFTDLLIDSLTFTAEKVAA